ncbi:MAG: hypothetical protein HIU57_08525 [Acidobacteria bacterium]|nr:hypothetical protein [Acidobacteriota bacterium]
MTFARSSVLSRIIVWSVLALMVVGWANSGARVGAATTAHLLLPPREPTGNFRLTNVNQVLTAIDAARHAEEGLAPLRFDATRFARLSVPEQIFVTSNLERTTRGLYPAVAMTSRLDAIATAAARRDEDPTDGSRSFSSIWSSAPASLGQSAFFADFGWMYDDGPPPQYIFRNVDCARAGEGGCWGHRDNILSNPLTGWAGCPSELVSGTGFAPRTPDGASLTEIFEVACSRSHDAAVFTWRHAVAYLHIPANESGLS